MDQCEYLNKVLTMTENAMRATPEPAKFGKCACCDKDALAYCHARNAWTCDECFLPQNEFSIHAAISRLTAENQTQAERIAKLEEALENISEYWNRSENDRAMNDALYHMIDIAEQALKGSRAKE